jgi:hypothetical protein
VKTELQTNSAGEFSLPSKVLTGPARAGLGILAKEMSHAVNES